MIREPAKTIEEERIPVLTSLVAPKGHQVAGTFSLLLKFAQPPFEKAALAVVRNQRKRAPVTAGSFLGGPHSAEQIRTRSVKQVIILEVAGRKCINDCQCRLGTVHHCDRHGTVQRHDW